MINRKSQNAYGGLLRHFAAGLLRIREYERPAWDIMASDLPDESLGDKFILREVTNES